MRQKFRWTATLQRDDGKIVERQMAVYWRPDQEDSAAEVAKAAAAEAYWASNKQHTFAPISASRVGQEEAQAA